MRTKALLLTGLMTVSVLALIPSAPAQAVDSDGDGIPDEEEAVEVVVDTPGSVGWYVDMVIHEGNPYISHHESGQELRFAASSDGGETWTNTVVDSGGDVGKWTGLAFNDGNPYISYQDEDSENLKYANSSDGGLTWTVQIVDSSGRVGYGSSLAFHDGNPYISHVYWDSFRVRLTNSSDGGATWTSRFVSAVNTAHPTTHLVFHEGLPYIAYWRAGSDAVGFLNTSAGGDTWTDQSIDPLGARDPELAFNDGQPVIVQVKGGTELRYSNSSDGGETWNSQTVFSTPKTFREPSVTFLAGNPIISYTTYATGTPNDLRIAFSNDMGTSWINQRVADSTANGWATSIDIIDDHPVIAYRSGGNLHFMHLYSLPGFNDTDGDGFLDGDDCKPWIPTIHPGAEDIPGNGIDEDCSGSDAKKSSGGGGGGGGGGRSVSPFEERTYHVHSGESGDHFRHPILRWAGFSNDDGSMPEYAITLRQYTADDLTRMPAPPAGTIASPFGIDLHIDPVPDFGIIALQVDADDLEGLDLEALGFLHFNGEEWGPVPVVVNRLDNGDYEIQIAVGGTTFSPFLLAELSPELLASAKGSEAAGTFDAIQEPDRGIPSLGAFVTLTAIALFAVVARRRL